MSERAVVRSDWPQPTVVAMPRVYADDANFALRYIAQDERIVIVRFPMCRYFVFGHPNDEALGGHPLSHSGLEHYSVHEVLESSLIKTLERRNSVHPRHSPELFSGLTHYIFTFQDCTLECVVNEGEFWPPTFAFFDNDREADADWQAHGHGAPTEPPERRRIEPGPN
jgi:hypothetical protein